MTRRILSAVKPISQIHGKQLPTTRNHYNYCQRVRLATMIVHMTVMPAMPEATAITMSTRSAIMTPTAIATMIVTTMTAMIVTTMMAMTATTMMAMIARHAMTCNAHCGRRLTVRGNTCNDHCKDEQDAKRLAMNYGKGDADEMERAMNAIQLPGRQDSRRRRWSYDRLAR